MYLTKILEIEKIVSAITQIRMAREMIWKVRSQYDSDELLNISIRLTKEKDRMSELLKQRELTLDERPYD